MVSPFGYVIDHTGRRWQREVDHVSERRHHRSCLRWSIRLASVTDWNGKTTTFSYDADGNLLGTNYRTLTPFASSLGKPAPTRSPRLTWHRRATPSRAPLAAISLSTATLSGLITKEADSGALSGTRGIATPPPPAGQRRRERQFLRRSRQPDAGHRGRRRPDLGLLPTRSPGPTTGHRRPRSATTSSAAGSAAYGRTDDLCVRPGWQAHVSSRCWDDPADHFVHDHSFVHDDHVHDGPADEHHCINDHVHDGPPSSTTSSPRGKTSTTVTKQPPSTTTTSSTVPRQVPLRPPRRRSRPQPPPLRPRRPRPPSRRQPRPQRQRRLLHRRVPLHRRPRTTNGPAEPSRRRHRQDHELIWRDSRRNLGNRL